MFNKFAVAGFAIALLFGAMPAHAYITGNVLTGNVLTGNVLTGNALGSNALTQNGQSVQGQSQNTMTRQIRVIGVELPATAH